MTMPTQGGAGLQAPSTLECAFTGRVEQAFRPFNLGMRFRRRGGAGLQALQPWNALSPAGGSKPFRPAPPPYIATAFTAEVFRRQPLLFCYSPPPPRPSRDGS